jgi:hypothetical protein
MHRIFGGARLVFWGVFPRARFRKMKKTGFRKRSCPREKLIGNRFNLKRLPVARQICP